MNRNMPVIRCKLIAARRVSVVIVIKLYIMVFLEMIFISIPNLLLSCINAFTIDGVE